MPYYPDLSPYVYFPDQWRETTVNVGWLNARRPFPTARPPAELRDRLWQYCQWSVAQARDSHPCELCHRLPQIPCGPTNATHQGKTLSLGHAEIRVFGPGNKIYAAPNLIFHYIVKHHYDPPAEFKEAVLQGLCPPDIAYFKQLKELDLAWMETYTPNDQTGWAHRFKERISQRDRSGWRRYLHPPAGQSQDAGSQPTKRRSC